MGKFEQRELKISFYLANMMGLKDITIELIEGEEGEVVTFIDTKGKLCMFNPFLSKTIFFDVYMWALDQGLNINAFKHNLMVKNPAGRIVRRAFHPKADDRNINIIEAIAELVGFKE